jgi:hypothetical protein
VAVYIVETYIINTTNAEECAAIVTVYRLCRYRIPRSKTLWGTNPAAHTDMDIFGG